MDDDEARGIPVLSDSFFCAGVYKTRTKNADVVQYGKRSSKRDI